MMVITYKLEEFITPEVMGQFAVSGITEFLLLTEILRTLRLQEQIMMII